jgi:acetoacetyl-CoA reductase
MTLEENSMRLALVTGGTRGIGEGICEQLLEHGYKVVTSYLSSDDKAEQLYRRTGIECYKFDIADYAACAEAVEKIKSKYGDISVLVNNAGIVRDNTMRNMPVEDWQSVLNTNLGGVFNLCRLLFPDMVKNNYGRIINISSLVGQCGGYGQVNYVSAKAGILGMTKALAIEGARFGVTVNAIAPGYIATDMLSGIPDRVMEKIITRIPVGRLGHVSDIARAVVFLAAEDAGFMTGSTISVNGGQDMH